MYNKNDETVMKIFTAYMKIALRNDLDKIDEKERKANMQIDFRGGMDEFENLLVEKDSFLDVFDGENQSELDFRDIIEDVELLNLLETLTEVQRTVLLEKLVHQRSSKEIADELGVTSRAVNKSAAKALDKLRNSLRST